MENGNIPDAAITASSRSSDARYARLNKRMVWCSDGESGSYLQVSLLYYSVSFDYFEGVI